MAVIPIDNWHHTGIVVRDLPAAIPRFARYFGIAEWEVRDYNAGNLGDMRYLGKPVEHSFLSATGHNGEIGFELIQPTSGASTYRDTLDNIGEGMHHVLPTICSEQEFAALGGLLANEGVGILQSGIVKGCMKYFYLDTRKLLANTLIKVVCPLRDDFKVITRPDRVVKVDLAKQGPAFLPTGKMLHVGVVCEDRDQVKASLSRLFGMDRWIEFEIESGVTIQDTTFYGETVYHAYDNHVGRKKSLCFELITPRTDKNVYHEFFQQRGEGMHHVFPTICGKQVFDAARPELEKAGMPVIQDGNIGGLMEYFYLDTREYLCGLTMEVVVPLVDDWLSHMFPNPEDASILTGE